MWLMKNLSYHAIKPEQIYHADSHKLPCIQTLYKCTTDTTKQLGPGDYKHKAHSAWPIITVCMASWHLSTQLAPAKLEHCRVSIV